VPLLAAGAVVVGRLSEVGLVVEDDFDERREADGKAELDLRFSGEATRWNERRRLRAVRVMAEMSGFIMSPSAMSVAIAETIDGAAAV
jgi:hypothetical protein